MRLPCHFHDKADSHAGVLVRAAESVDDIKLFVGQFLYGEFLYRIPRLLRRGMVVVFVLVRGPPNGILGVFVHDDKLVLGRTTRVYTRHDVDGTKFAYLTFFVTRKSGIGLLFEQQFVRRIVHDFGGACNTVFC